MYPGLEARAVQLKSEGGTYRQIASQLSGEVGAQITENQVDHKMRRLRGGSGARIARVGSVSARPVIVSNSSTKNGLADNIRKLLIKEPLGVYELADRLDVPPKRIREQVGVLQENGYNVAVHDGDGAEARFMIETNGAAAHPELRINAEKFYDGAFRFDFGVVSDTHLGSKFYRPEVLNAIYDNFAQHGIKHVFHGGNYIEGEKHDKFGLLVHGMQGQIDYFIQNYPAKEGMTTYFVAGDDHEGWYQQREGIDIGRFTESEARRQGREDLINLGYMEADVAINIPGGAKTKLRVMHAGGGSSYAISYSAQKIIEAMEGGEKPAILLIGHFHKSDYLPAYRNVHCIQMGTTKGQDVFMRKQRLAAHVGGWRCSALLGKDGSVREFSATYLPFYNQGYYESLSVDGQSGEVTFVGANETFNVVH